MMNKNKLNKLLLSFGLCTVPMLSMAGAEQPSESILSQKNIAIAMMAVGTAGAAKMAVDRTKLFVEDMTLSKALTLSAVGLGVGGASLYLYNKYNPVTHNDVDKACKDIKDTAESGNRHVRIEHLQSLNKTARRFDAKVDGLNKNLDAQAAPMAAQTKVAQDVKDQLTMHSGNIDTLHENSLKSLGSMKAQFGLVKQKCEAMLKKQESAMQEDYAGSLGTAENQFIKNAQEQFKKLSAQHGAVRDGLATIKQSVDSTETKASCLAAYARDLQNKMNTLQATGKQTLEESAALVQRLEKIEKDVK